MWQPLVDPDFWIEALDMAGNHGQAVGEDQSTDGEEENAAENLDGMKVSAKLLVKLHEAADADRREQEGDRKAGGIQSQEDDAFHDLFPRRRDRQDSCENRSDARCPAKGKRESEQESAYHPGLISADVAQVNVAIQPSRERRPKKENHGCRIEMHGFEDEVRARAEEQKRPDGNEGDAEDHADANRDLDQPADQVQTKENDQCAGDGREQIAIL